MKGRNEKKLEEMEAKILKLSKILNSNKDVFDNCHYISDLFRILLTSDCDSHIRIVSHYVMLIERTVDDIRFDEGYATEEELERYDLKDRKIDLIEQMYKAII